MAGSDIIVPGFMRAQEVRLLARMMAVAALLLSLGPAVPAAHADDWPTRPVRVLIPFTAGGTADTLGRIAAEKLSAAFGQQFVPENKAGASGLIAAAEAANAAPDGYTLFVSGVGGLIISTAISPNPPADSATGYTHIAHFGGPPAVLLVNNDVPANNLAAFIAHAKANPGKLNYGSPSPGSLANLAFMLFQRQADIRLQNVAYRGASQAMTDLMGGHIAVTSTALTSAAGTILAGNARPLAVTSRKRVPDYPHIPTFAELGFPDIVAEVWFALSGPRGIPDDIVRKLNAAVVKGLQEPDARQRLARDVIDPQPYDPAAFATFYRAENDKWGPLAKEIIGTDK
jgi:tripartite-type tricarboxylate transporter receptor subunit TctC